MNKIELLHGTDHIIEVPNITKGNSKNDYGKGFYCTRLPEMAKEWACKQNTDGFINRYELDLTDYTAEEKDELNAFSKQYRENERFQLDCDLYRLVSPESDKFCAYMQVTKDKQRALFTFLHINSTGFYENIVVRLAGLADNVVYENTATGTRLTGKAWMKLGLRIPDLFKEKSGSGFQTLFVVVK